MPISPDPAARQRQIDALESYRGRPGYRPTKPLRLTLPIALADAFEAMTKDERTELIIRAMDPRQDQMSSEVE
jgi:hypothetical protein